MSDIVERLRKGIEWTGPTQDDTGQTENLMDEAADEIERLREGNREIALNAREFAAENEKLRAALKDCIEVLDDLKWNTGAVERARAALGEPENTNGG